GPFQGAWDGTPAPARAATEAFYGSGDQASLFVGTEAAVFESLVDDNLANAPALSPGQWTPVGTAYSPYAPGSYAKDAIVTNVASHRLFKSLVDANSAALTDITRWQDFSPTNRWAAFDGKRSNQSKRPGELYFEIQATKRVDTIGLLALGASRANIKVEVAGEVLREKNISLISSYGIRGRYSWLFEPIVRKSAIVVSGLPIDLNPKLSITLTGGAEVAVGHIVHGRSRKLGGTQFGAELGMTDFSKFEEDGFGGLEVLVRGYRDRGSFTVEVDNRAVDGVVTLIKQYHATPVLVVASENFASMIYFGLLKFGGIVVSNARKSILAVDVDAF
ncbi:hypothetical protein, partial [Methylorubrum thiocyanatum]|uniref:hypothetical protein n=1 Tax=Methylorubrum thiocyanatum TaxID=47958 RepID=UPI0035C84E3A